MVNLILTYESTPYNLLFYKLKHEYDTFDILFILHESSCENMTLETPPWFFSTCLSLCVLPFGEKNRPSCYKLRISRKQKNSKNNEEESDRSFSKSRSKKYILTHVWNRGKQKVFIYVEMLRDLLYWAKFLVVFINNSFCFCFCSCPCIMFANTKPAQNSYTFVISNIVQGFSNGSKKKVVKTVQKCK